MNLGVEKNLKIIEKYCLVEGGCPKLKKCKDYTERVAVCSQCIDKVYKYDMMEIIRYLKENQVQGTQVENSKPTPPKTGKGTEQSTPRIRMILDYYYNQKKSINWIATELHLQHLTVKNIIRRSFKNQTSNDKVTEVMKDMNLIEEIEKAE